MGGSLGEKLRKPSTWASLVVVLLVAALVLWSEYGSQGDDVEGSPQPTSSATSTQTARATSSPTSRATRLATARPSARPSAPRTSTSGPDSSSGLSWIDAADLPDEGREVLQAIDDGGPFVREKDGSTFGNYEGVLPSRQRGYYREYTVPTPGVSHAGARRIVTGGDDEYFWTADHYETFERIRR